MKPGSEGGAPRAAPGPLQLFLDSPFPCLLQDAAFRIVDVNPAFAEFIGYARERLQGIDSLALLHPEDQPAALTLRERLARGDSADALPRLIERRLIDAAGRARWHRASLQATVDAEGRPLLLSLIQDLSGEHAARAAADEALRELEQERDLARVQLGAMMDAAGVGIATFQESSGWARQRAGGNASANPASATLQSIGRDVVVPASLPEYERLQHALRHAQRAEVRYAIRHADLGERWLLTRIEPATLASGDRATSVVTLDITEQHRAEMAVTLQADRTRAILDSVLVGIVTVGPGGIEWMNRSARRMFGGDLADFLGQPIGTVATSEDGHPFHQTQYLEGLVEGQAETFECRVRARDGRAFWVVGNAVATGREGAGRQLTYALLDIERRREAEARTLEAQRSLQRVIEAAPMAISLRDARTLRLVQINEAAARSVGRAPDQLIGRTPEELYAPELALERRRHMEQALASRNVTQVEYRFRVDGQERVWDARYLPLAAPGQAADQLLLVATDVTEQRAALEARFAAELAQREMLVREVHHRIKNNLQGVAGLLQQIAGRKPEVAAVISEVVSQLEAIAQVFGLQVGLAGPLKMQSVVEAIAGSVQKSFGIPLALAIEGTAPGRWALPEVESIPIALTLNELLSNAIKHSTGDPAQPVECRLQCSEGGVRVLIGNHGRLPDGFSLARVPGGVSGLGLVRSLLPRRHAGLTLEQHGERVIATVSLVPPCVTRLDAG